MFQNSRQECKHYNHFGNGLVVSYKLFVYLPNNPVILLLSIYSIGIKTYSPKGQYKNVTALFQIVKNT